MKFFSGLGAIILTIGLAGGFAAVPERPAKAQGFFDQIFGPSSYRGRDRSYSRRNRGSRSYRYRRGSSRNNRGYWGIDGYEQPVYDEPRRRRSSNRDRPVEDTHVKPPRYFTYKPDVLKTISFAGLAEQTTALNAPLDAVVEPMTFAEARMHLSSFRMRLLPQVGQAVMAYYKASPKFLWVANGEVTGKARAAMMVLEDAADVGLDAKDYAVSMPSPAYDVDGEGRQQTLAEFEIALSSKVLSYILDASRGRIDPNRISEYHDFKRKDADLVAMLDEIKDSGNVAGYIESKNPQNKTFTALANELKVLRSKDDENQISIAAGTFVRPGGSSPEMSNIIGAIRAMASDKLQVAHADTLAGYLGGTLYSEELVALVKDFQKDAGLKPDGVIGRNTIAAMMQDSNAEKIRKLELAMERLRWLPRDLGERHVFINQPAYTASYIDGGETKLSMRAVVGKKSNQTNFFMDKVEIVEFNPYWGVPHSIIANEMVPKLYNDPSYLDRLGYEVTTVQGERVSSWDVDWGAVASKQASINVRQPPGRGNALGLVKILFPNKHHIYMHDTPHKKLFNRSTRAFSHGCVRLHKPREMAAAVLGKPVSYINQRIAEGKNAQDKISVNLPVYVAYFTAWPADDGTVNFYDDMYARDDYLTKALERTNAARANS